MVLVDDARRIWREATMDLRQGRETPDDYAAARQRLAEIRDACSQQEARQVQLYVDLLDEEWLEMTAGPAAAEEHWRTRRGSPSGDETSLPGLGPGESA